MKIKVKQRGIRIKEVVLWKENPYTMFGVVKLRMIREKGRLVYNNSECYFGGGNDGKGNVYNGMYFNNKDGNKYASVEFYPETKDEKKLMDGHMLRLSNHKGDIQFFIMSKLKARKSFKTWGKGVPRVVEK